MAKCVDCGFLCVVDDDEPHIATRSVRKHGHAYQFSCFKGEFDLDAEPRVRRDAGDTRFDDWSEVLNKARECNKWFRWREGYSPKEHDEMKLLQEVERRNDAAQRRMEQRATLRGL